MQNQTTISQKRNWPLILSIVCILLSAFYCSLSTYGSFSGNEGVYAIRMVSTQLADLTIKGLAKGVLCIIIPAWFLIWVILTGFSRTIWNTRIIILLAVFTSIFAGIGFVSGTLNSFSNVDTVYYNDKSYYLSYYFNASDNGFYDLVECRIWAIVCNRVAIVGDGYPEIAQNASLEVNENKHELAIIIEGKTVYTQPLG